MTNIIFKPWEGKAYETGGIFGKKILVLGESVYCGETGCKSLCSERCNEFTINLVKEFVANDVHTKSGEFKYWTNTYKKFESALVGHSPSLEERKQIWESILFYTFFQEAFYKARQPLSGKLDTKRAQQALVEVLEKYRPDYVIVWGYRLWDCLTGENWTNTAPIINEGLKSGTGYYTIDGIKYPFMYVNHPSGGFSWSKWHLNIKQFLETK